eukprot:1303669-Pleurochrysis_carterae.AAC.6
MAYVWPFASWRTYGPLQHVRKCARTLCPTVATFPWCVTPDVKHVMMAADKRPCVWRRVDDQIVRTLNGNTAPACCLGGGVVGVNASLSSLALLCMNLDICRC